MGTAKTWFMLFAAIACEVCGTTSLKLSQAFTVLGPSIVVVVAYVASFYLLALVLKDMSLGLAYGVWGGVGTLATALVGTVVFGDPFTAIMALGLVLVIAGIALMSKGTEEAEARMLSSD